MMVCIASFHKPKLGAFDVILRPSSYRSLVNLRAFFDSTVHAKSPEQKHPECEESRFLSFVLCILKFHNSPFTIFYIYLSFNRTKRSHFYRKKQSFLLCTCKRMGKIYFYFLMFNWNILLKLRHLYV